MWRSETRIVRNARHWQRETHSHEAKSRWDRGWWIMMGDDHGLNENPRVGRVGTVSRGTQAFVHFSTSNSHHLLLLVE